MDFSALFILRTGLSRCVLTTIETVELSVAVCSKMADSVQNTLCNLPFIGDYGLQAFACSLIALCLISFILWYRRYNRTTHMFKKCTPQQWNLMLDLAKTAHVSDNASRLIAMIEAGHIDVNAHTDSDTGLTLLLSACLSGHLELIKYLIDKGADTSSLTHDQDTALILATFASCSARQDTVNCDLIDLLACRGLNVNARNKHGDSALSVAAVYGRTQLITMLLEYGADPSLPSSAGYLPVVFAGHSGNLKAAQLLETNQSSNNNKY